MKKYRLKSNTNKTIKIYIYIYIYIYSKKACKTRGLSHEIKINSKKKIKENHKTNIFLKKLMQNNKIA